MPAAQVTSTRLDAVSRRGREKKDDLLAVEEPLEIRIVYGAVTRRRQKSLAVTMRTPGNDFELAAGFLQTEGVVRSSNDILAVRHCTGGEKARRENIVVVELAPAVHVDIKRLTRHFFASSSCGICGKASIDAVRIQLNHRFDHNFAAVSAATIHALPEKSRKAQTVFCHTGGLHAAALFNHSGDLTLLREDVGRHNALDKVIGAAMHLNLLPLSDHILFLSGRAGFELVQKAAAAGAAVVAAVGAPSSLAVELAEEAGLTLIGFVRSERFNIYSHPERIEPVYAKNSFDRMI